jgi:hypothetical protein
MEWDEEGVCYGGKNAKKLVGDVHTGGQGESGAGDTDGGGRSRLSVTEPTNYMRLSKKIIHRTDDLTNLSPYNPVVREITTDFKPTYIPAKIVISSTVTITSYIKIRVTNTSEFKHSYYKLVSNESS